MIGKAVGEKMVKAIVRDPLFLAQKSVPATEADKQVVQDLLDTLRANLDRCVGMAANMIGVRKNIIVVAMGPFQFAMINPVITKKKEAFQLHLQRFSLTMKDIALIFWILLDIRTSQKILIER